MCTSCNLFILKGRHIIGEIFIIVSGSMESALTNSRVKTWLSVGTVVDLLGPFGNVMMTS